MRPLILTLTLLTLAFSSGLAGANHETRVDERLVAPHGLPVLTHIPVVAGYEPVPTPMHCLAGASADGDVYSEDFEGSHGYATTSTPLSPNSPNMWHVGVDEVEGGTTGHSQQNRLYFGRESSRDFNDGHVAGTIYSPVIDLPAQDTYLSFATKWEVEYLKGYDHMWVEMLEVRNPEHTSVTHLLCTANALDRAEPASQGDFHQVGSCSPILFGPCPSFVDPLWETRFIPIPSYLEGKSIRVRFTFDSSDPVANMFMGWMVDDVRIGTGLSGV